MNHTSFFEFSHSVLSDCVIPWTVTHQASLFVGFPRQKYWSGLPFPPSGDLPNSGIEPVSDMQIPRSLAAVLTSDLGVGPGCIT